jgi:hypothetical protein
VFLASQNRQSSKALKSRPTCCAETYQEYAKHDCPYREQNCDPVAYFGSRKNENSSPATKCAQQKAQYADYVLSNSVGLHFEHLTAQLAYAVMTNVVEPTAAAVA